MYVEEAPKPVFAYPIGPIGLTDAREGWDLEFLLAKEECWRIRSSKKPLMSESDKV